MPYTKDDPKFVKAESVKAATPHGLYVDVVAYGEVFKMCHVDSFNILNPSESSVLVQDSQGNWLRIRFSDEDIEPYEDN